MRSIHCFSTLTLLKAFTGIISNNKGSDSDLVGSCLLFATKCAERNSSPISTTGCAGDCITLLTTGNNTETRSFLLLSQRRSDAVLLLGCDNHWIKSYCNSLRLYFPCTFFVIDFHAGGRKQNFKGKIGKIV